ncbi:tyrosine-protein phosphatase [Nostocoides sp. HKS02]|uniref:tyrosine-protein phosphatase n=1 Tax=Nostocoides sp. HKS02 TaxID=1813880 RepID=UPI0012B46C09|nr:tyrosine-protein phosphatase [Tetrasphaera sp. HKS02]QGN56955.1 protein-tyrosine-phosphatase [Tetrasphaera sp. HKS02]
MTTPHWIDLDGVVNMRDVGGLPTTDGGRIAPGRLLRSDNLQDLSDADVERLVGELGVSDIVDLRSTVEVHLEGPGPLRTRELVPHHHHSLVADDAIDADAAAAAALVLPWSKRSGRPKPPRRDDDYWASHYLGYLVDRPDSVSAALHVIARSTGATVVHCAAGKDRTGTVVGLTLSVAGVADEDVVADYVASAERIEQIVARLLPRPAYGEALRDQPLAHHTPRAETMERILTVLAQRHGGAAGWLGEQGWSQAEVDALRARLRA